MEPKAFESDIHAGLYLNALPDPDVDLDSLDKVQDEQLKKQLAKQQAVIEVQGKVHALLEELSKSADTDQTSTES